jgi:hypothetical protein
MKPFFPAPVTCALPSWDELREQTLANRALITAWRGKRPEVNEPLQMRSALSAAVKFAASTLAGSSRLARLRSWTAEELALFVLQQAYLNERASDEAQDSPGLLFGSHNQLPCTAATLKRRLVILAEHVPASAPILIIGDDDLQCIGLARLGYSDITVVEIDPVIVGHIRDISRQEKLGIRVECGNIQEIGTDLTREYRATLIDPPTDEIGLDAFVSGVFRLNATGSRNLLFLSTNPLSHQRHGYEQLRSVLNRHFSLRERHTGINVYSIPRIPKALLNIGMQLAEPHLAVGRIRFYCADLFIFEGKEPSQENPVIHPETGGGVEKPTIAQHL